MNDNLLDKIYLLTQNKTIVRTLSGYSCPDISLFIKDELPEKLIHQYVIFYKGDFIGFINNQTNQSTYTRLQAYFLAKSNDQFKRLTEFRLNEFLNLEVVDERTKTTIP